MSVDKTKISNLMNKTVYHTHLIQTMDKDMVRLIHTIDKDMARALSGRGRKEYCESLT